LVEAYVNSIGGEPRAAESRAVFEVSGPASAASGALSSRPGRPPARSLGTWPRSGSADVAAAVEAALSSAESWRSLGSERRRAIVARAAEELAREPDPKGLFAARIGADPSEVSPHGRGIPAHLAPALDDPAAAVANPRAAEPGLLLFAPAWCELYESPALSLFSALLLGRTVVFMSDPHAPMIADAFAAALDRAGLPRGVLSVVHDDGDDALRAAFAGGAATWVVGSGYPGRVRRLEKLASCGPPADFGAGVRATARCFAELRILRSRTLVLDSGHDLDARADEVARHAFGRSATLSGQLAGQIARVVCPERRFSKFTETLLARLRSSADVLRPIPLVERASVDLLRRVRFLGLDENATLIFDGGDALANRSAGAPSSPAVAETRSPAPESTSRAPESSTRTPESASRTLGEDAILSPTVFTNVEERMRISSFGRPIPVLCLLRAGTDEDARAIAGRLDRDVPAEDLSLDPPE
jgi:acyl-CoA reductase-like NAD-dependent aldehyde dehydrogenase